MEAECFINDAGVMIFKCGSFEISNDTLWRGNSRMALCRADMEALHAVLHAWLIAGLWQKSQKVLDERDQVAEAEKYRLPEDG
jgi:hypothetical protein